MNTSKNRWIKKVAVLGSGIMGSRIALHLANAGIPSLLLDIVPKELTPDEEKKGLTLQSKEVRNRIVNQSLTNAIKSNPSPVYSQKFVSRIETGNFEDDMHKIKDCDWIVEAVVERIDIKKTIFDQVEKHRKPGSIISSNTSGIPIHLMAEGRSEDFRRHFLGTHFFNPPRYLPLLEIIPTPHTDPEIVDFFMHWGDRYLGKTTVLCKDTPAFIANRVGVFGIMAIFHAVRDMGLTVEEIDKLTGPVLGRPKSATFRTADVVGLDTLIHVANGLYQALPHDEQRELFRLPDFIQKMQQNNWLGDKTGQGFYKKIKNPDGSSTILSLDLNTLEYKEQKKAKFPTLEQTKNIDQLSDRYRVLIEGQDKAGEFYRRSFAALFSYVAHRIPEISDEIYRIDAAMRAGFGWEHGPFEIWDALGISKGIELTRSQGYTLPEWVTQLPAKGIEKFYQTTSGTQQYIDINTHQYTNRPDLKGIIILDHRRSTSTLWSNSECAVIDLGDGILNIEFRSKMNTLGSGVLAGINKGIELAEKSFRGVVISNQGTNFSVGANLMMVYMMAVEQEYDELNFAIKYFQDTVMRLRYSHIPVVVAPHGMTLGGGCELVLHADAVQAAAETYMGLVEFGVGVIPGGGGTKELTRRSALRYIKDDIELNVLRENFYKIATAKVATSATEAFEFGYLIEGRDRISLNKNRLISDAKNLAISLADAGYTMPTRDKFKVLGRTALGMFAVGIHQMVEGGYATEYEAHMANKLAYVMAGGDLSEPTLVSEQYLLDLEREAFLHLCTQRKTLERIHHMLNTGKPLRN
ncbi:3-hydroxyacyl-CoA dehydrogenase/enoyl-CoA hydratase family protein [Schleiferia thermophila]|jgi:3-hydroxyacyl-CoA dehydrogenase|uniref:3-hydroxyacyl-CoA dehydrogenase n=1 Tax=Schleiferia thermophila TaxID=884107 RepID=A0A369A3V5_9FLAO|nr:3-hydroxyacyl-CoA dehydrogenase/enoyl-CoA hydratase family protein [Schleiferia thermophila]KFD39677.1 3-hydroxyacyl-CoA dehydrogenase [Schleiferia thermophila str. Yellowstone]RCX03853.1 3-hydroxyacyl-CoA dehydrogenase [Schleiferia thermophila]GCD80085.1 3-hydroxyacyl-CoA dehydrogenase [Schleiferia thermophila]